MNKSTGKLTSGSTNTKEIPQELKDFYNRNYIVFIGGCGSPKEFSSLGDGFKGERNVTQEDIDSFSRSTLLYISQFKHPDFILKGFRSGSVNFYQV